MITTFSEVAEASPEPVRIVLEEFSGYRETLEIERDPDSLMLHRLTVEDGLQDRRDMIGLTLEEARKAARGMLALTDPGCVVLMPAQLKRLMMLAQAIEGEGWSTAAARAAEIRRIVGSRPVLAMIGDE